MSFKKSEEKVIGKIKFRKGKEAKRRKDSHDKIGKTLNRRNRKERDFSNQQLGIKLLNFSWHILKLSVRA